jgi:hypothetical protein
LRPTRDEIEDPVAIDVARSDEPGNARNTTCCSGYAIEFSGDSVRAHRSRDAWRHQNRHRRAE